MKIIVSKEYDTYYAVDDHTYGGPGSPIGSGHTVMDSINDLCEMIISNLETHIDRLRYENHCLRAELAGKAVSQNPPEEPAHWAPGYDEDNNKE